jgi:hypothetical protein
MGANPSFSDRRYHCDAYKDAVVVEIEGVDKNKVIDYYYCKLFRFLAWRDAKKAQVGVLTITDKLGSAPRNLCD